MRCLVALFAVCIGTSIHADAMTLAATARVVARPTPSALEMQLATARVNASAARLKALARSAESQPQSAPNLQTLRNQVIALEADYEYLIGMFSASNAKDHAAQLKLMQDILNNLKKFEDDISKKLAEKLDARHAAKVRAQGAADIGWIQVLRDVTALSDRAAASADLRRFAVVTPTPAR